ncbi:MAG: DNA-3-methyladenine glycosylase [Lacrimispora sp.]|uniref:DNA-3-methyladenine glycosylase n=1 Tax=Lacrimispora sp. TaxID=2719234 RepID=UPI0039E23484
MKTLNRDFYNRDSIIVAKELLGKILVHETGGKRISARIVETEAYMGVIDKAAHSYGGKRTPRVEVMYGEPGHSYVYLIYGMYHCFNMVTGPQGVPQAVLIRALEPVEGLDMISHNRYQKPYGELNKKQITGLTSGPGKLCRAFLIDKELNGEDLCGSRLYVEEGETDGFSIAESRRVGIDYAEEARDFLWRFYIEGNPYVSVK